MFVTSSMIIFFLREILRTLVRENSNLGNFRWKWPALLGRVSVNLYNHTQFISLLTTPPSTHTYTIHKLKVVDIKNLFIPPQTWLPLPYYISAHSCNLVTQKNTYFIHSVHFAALIAPSEFLYILYILSIEIQWSCKHICLQPLAFFIKKKKETI